MIDRSSDLLDNVDPIRVVIRLTLACRLLYQDRSLELVKNKQTKTKNKTKQKGKKTEVLRLLWMLMLKFTWNQLVAVQFLFAYSPSKTVASNPWKLWSCSAKKMFIFQNNMLIHFSHCSELFSTRHEVTVRVFLSHFGVLQQKKVRSTNNWTFNTLMVSAGERVA